MINRLIESRMAGIIFDGDAAAGKPDSAGGNGISRSSSLIPPRSEHNFPSVTTDNWPALPACWLETSIWRSTTKKLAAPLSTRTAGLRVLNASARRYAGAAERCGATLGLSSGRRAGRLQTS